MSVCVCVCMGVCVCVCMCVYTITRKNNGSVHLKLEHITCIVYKKSSDESDIGLCLIKDR